MKKHTNHKGFFIFGKNAVYEAIITNPAKIKEVFFVREKDKDASGLEEVSQNVHEKNIKANVIDRKRAFDMVGEVKHQGVIAYYTGFEYKRLDESLDEWSEMDKTCVLLLDKVEDMHNFGAIIRTAAAAGVTAIIVPEHSQAPVNGTVFKTSAGQVSRMNVIQVTSISQAIIALKDADFWIYGIDMDDPSNPYPSGNIWEQKFDHKAAIIVGSEGKGISEKAREKCDFFAPIPMEKGVESLNVSVAAAIALYEWKKQMTQK